MPESILGEKKSMIDSSLGGMHYKQGVYMYIRQNPQEAR